MPLDPAIRDAMRDSRDAFSSDDELDADEFADANEDTLAGLRRAGLTTDLQGPEVERETRRYTVRDEEADEDDDDDDGDETVKVKNPNLSNRLPREDFAPVVEFDDRPPLMERCQDVLKERLKITRMGFLLDGKPANTDKVVAAAGLLFKDEEPIRRSPPTRQRKRKKKF